MFYATYKGIGNSDVAEFMTEQERNDWVNFTDEYSKVFGITKENATFERKSLTDKKTIAKIIDNKNIKKVVDVYNPNQNWYLRSLL